MPGSWGNGTPMANTQKRIDTSPAAGIVAQSRQDSQNTLLIGTAASSCARPAANRIRHGPSGGSIATLDIVRQVGPLGKFRDHALGKGAGVPFGAVGQAPEGFIFRQ